ncbi:MAG: Eco57I restriction-modification methylase domain-containing protein [Promethearchaeota archaeon]
MGKIKNTNGDFYEFSLLNTPVHLSELLEQINQSKITQTGGIFTPSIIAHSICEYTLDRWLLNQYGSKFASESLETDLLHNYLSNLEKWIHPASKKLQSEMIQFGFDLLKSVKILDPCVGGGIFVIELLQIILTYLEKLFVLSRKFQPKSSIKQEDYLFDILESFIIKNLYYIDLDVMALEITSLRIQAWLISMFSDGYRSRILNMSLSFNGIKNNALKLDNDFFSSKFHINGFDLIIGNPPYLGSDNLSKNIPKEEFIQLKKRYRKVINPGNKTDLFFFFIAQFAPLLRIDGFLSFIVPNRILINHYASDLRTFLLTNFHLELILDFASDLQLFSNINVHPCVLGISNKESTNDSKSNYYGMRINSTKEFHTFFNPNINAIPLELCREWNLFFSSLSLAEIKLLALISKFPKLGNFFEIHEGTRMFRFKNQIPLDLSPQITKKEYDYLNLKIKEHYLGEIRGKQIKRYTISDPEQFLFVSDEFLKNKDEPKIYMRELGSQMFISYYFQKNDEITENPKIGYGGIYFINFSDKNFDNLKIFFPDLSKEMLFRALVPYLASSIILNIYKILFGSGAWGNALKFRSSYLVKVPIIPKSKEVWKILAKSEKKLRNLSQKSNLLSSQIILFLETQINYLILGDLLFIDREDSGFVHFRFQFSKFLDIDNYNEITEFKRNMILFNNSNVIFMQNLQNHPLFHLLTDQKIKKM